MPKDTYINFVSNKRLMLSFSVVGMTPRGPEEYNLSWFIFMVLLLMQTAKEITSRYRNSLFTTKQHIQASINVFIYFMSAYCATNRMVYE